MKLPKSIKVYGDTAYRGKCHSEAVEQATFFNVLRVKYPHLHALAFHVKNEGKRTHGQYSRDKAQGLNKGVCDIVIPCCPPILIELKRRDHTLSRISKEQVDYIELAQSHGAFACVALGSDGAIQAIEDYYEHVHDKH